MGVGGLGPEKRTFYNFFVKYQFYVKIAKIEKVRKVPKSAPLAPKGARYPYAQAFLVLFWSRGAKKHFWAKKCENNQKVRNLAFLGEKADF